MSFCITYDINKLKNEKDYEEDLDYIGVLADNREVAGLCAYSYDEDTMYFQHIEIREAYRGRHLADMLINELKSVATQQGFNGIVVRFVADVGMNDIVSCLLCKHGFMLPTITDRSYSVKISDLGKTRLMTDDKICNLDCEYESVNNYSMKKILGFFKAKLAKKKMAEVQDNYEKDLSVVSKEKKNCVVYSVSDKDIILELAQAENQASIKEFMVLLYCSVCNIIRDYKKYDFLKVCAINEASKNLIERLLKGADYQVHNLIDSYILL